MGRTRIANALIRDLEERKKNSQRRKKELLEYLKRLEHLHSKENISGERYIEIIHKKTSKIAA